MTVDFTTFQHMCDGGMLSHPKDKGSLQSCDFPCWIQNIMQIKKDIIHNTG